MFVSQVHGPARSDLPAGATANAQVAVVGITHPQTCLNLTGRLAALRQAGFRVILVSSPGELLQSTAAEQDAEAVPLQICRKIAPLSDLVSFIRLWLLMRRLRPRLVEFSSPKAGLLGTIAARFARVPVRIYMLRGLRLETAAGMKRHMLLTAERAAAACAHVVLCNSDSVRTLALRLGIAPAAKLALLGHGSTNGVDTSRFSPGPAGLRRNLGFALSDPVIGFVGRFTRDKGIPELLASFHEILRFEPSARLLLAGWFDEAEDALDAGIRAHILDHPRIHCTEGRVADTAPYYRAMDLLVLPTWREGFPNVVLEASSTAIPVITTDSTGARDSVVPEVTGLLIPPGCPEAITAAVLKLIRNSACRARMGSAGRAWVMENFSRHAVLDRTIAFYKSLADQSQARL